MNNLEMLGQGLSLVGIGTITFLYLGLIFNHILRHVTPYVQTAFARIEKHLGN